MFKHMGTGPNGTSLRSTRYPPIPDPEVVKENQLRCAEHTDIGCVTLLFQDRPGLEVCTEGDNYVLAPPIPGTVVVNIGDMLQWWTADKLVSTKYRVNIPETAEGRGKGRRSIAFFAKADSDVQLKCLDGSDKYKPMLVREYHKMKLRTTYI
ncbi:2-oxoglutarate-Fe(II) type oxidoreductase ppzD-like [Branchiostoma floridae]|nr:2-oxoglutarate-Fe(II) type oxidoreductase ppzD-like [Branchiostoma floridae]